MRYLLFVALVALQLGCVSPIRRAKAAPPPPGPMPARIPDVIATSDSQPSPRNLPQPPAVAVNTPDPATTGAIVPKQTLPPPPPRPRPKRRVTRPVVASAKPEPAEVETPGPPPFQLGEVTTPQRREELLRQADTALAVCAKALAAVEGKRLRNPQINLVARIRRFSDEARAAMDKEPVRARNLAERARAFADALLTELK